MMDLIWMGLILVSLVFGLLNGRTAAVSAAALEGAGAAAELCLKLCGALCLWSGVLKLLEKGGAAAVLGRLLRPLLLRLYPEAREDPAALAALAENMSANLLGLGNAATPAGIRAAKALARGNTASDSLCRLTVLNSASIQLIPAAVCALRGAAGAAQPFDILPAVWLTSLCSAAAGLAAERLLRRPGR
jgi:spore maturation protein A